MGIANELKAILKVKKVGTLFRNLRHLLLTITMRKEPFLRYIIRTLCSLPLHFEHGKYAKSSDIKFRLRRWIVALWGLARTLIPMFRKIVQLLPYSYYYNWPSRSICFEELFLLLCTHARSIYVHVKGIVFMFFSLPEEQQLLWSGGGDLDLLMTDRFPLDPCAFFFFMELAIINLFTLLNQYPAVQQVYGKLVRRLM